MIPLILRHLRNFHLLHQQMKPALVNLHIPRIRNSPAAAPATPDCDPYIFPHQLLPLEFIPQGLIEIHSPSFP